MAIDVFAEYAKAAIKLRGMQAKWADLYLNDPQVGGNAEGSARKAGYAEGSLKSTIHQWTPKPGDDEALQRGELVRLNNVKIAILWGLRCKAETARKSEMQRAETRAKLHITTDRVLRSLLEIAERTAGYSIDADGNREGKFQEAQFKPGTSQRAFELIGKDMGMFFDRGAGPQAKTYDQMDMGEIDGEIAKLDAQIAAAGSAIKDANARQPRVLPTPSTKATTRGSKTKH